MEAAQNQEACEQRLLKLVAVGKPHDGPGQNRIAVRVARPRTWLVSRGRHV